MSAVIHIYSLPPGTMYFCCCSVTQSCLTLCDPTDSSTPGLLSLIISRSLPKFMFIALVMPSSHLILWCPLLLLPPIFPSIRDFSESSVRIRWPKYWSFSFSISTSSEYSLKGWSPLRLTGLISLLSKGLSGVFSSTTVWRHQFFGILLSLWSRSHNHNDRWHDYSLDYMDLCRLSNICFSTHCLGLLLLFCWEAIIFWFHGHSHHPQWFWSPRRGNLSLLSLFLLLFAMQ